MWVIIIECVNNSEKGPVYAQVGKARDKGQVGVGFWPAREERPAAAASPGFGLVSLSSDSDRRRPCRVPVRIRVGFAGPGSDSDRIPHHEAGSGSVLVKPAGSVAY